MPSGNSPGGSGTGGTPAGAAAGTSGTGATPAAPPSGAGASRTADVVINEKQFASDPAWPADLILDRLKSNWDRWDRRLNLVVDQRNFSLYLNGSLPCPDPAIHPKAATNWKGNDRCYVPSGTYQSDLD
ncbi:hypothetical protein EDB85DRAFT_2147724 [Lactarius pseudohatsudake]|nr:hypothetical protein EDB85DRAFT_2147724 [Lactarius pseudohatsudake]